MTRAGEEAPNRTCFPPGMRFGKWVITGPITAYSDGKYRKHSYAPVACECGTVAEVRTGDLRNGKSTKCRECSWRENPRDKQKTKRAWLLAEKNNPCTDCGIALPHYCMQFDHVPERGEKLFEINLGTTQGRRALEEFQAERKKCDLVCSNCHDHRTWERRSGLPHTPLELLRGENLPRVKYGQLILEIIEVEE